MCPESVRSLTRCPPGYEPATSDPAPKRMDNSRGFSSPSARHSPIPRTANPASTPALTNSETGCAQASITTVSPVASSSKCACVPPNCWVGCSSAR